MVPSHGPNLYPGDARCGWTAAAPAGIQSRPEDNNTSSKHRSMQGALDETAPFLPLFHLRAPIKNTSAPSSDFFLHKNETVWMKFSTSKQRDTTLHDPSIPCCTYSEGPVYVKVRRIFRGPIFLCPKGPIAWMEVAQRGAMMLELRCTV